MPRGDPIDPGNLRGRPFDPTDDDQRLPSGGRRAAGLEIGKRLVAHAERPGRVVFEREVDVLAEFADALTGVYEPDGLTALRDEWG